MRYNYGFEKFSSKTILNCNLTSKTVHLTVSRNAVTLVDTLVLN
jgi:hypothetical protein